MEDPDFPQIILQYELSLAWIKIYSYLKYNSYLKVILLIIWSRSIDKERLKTILESDQIIGICYIFISFKIKFYQNHYISLYHYKYLNCRKNILSLKMVIDHYVQKQITSNNLKHFG